jgi:hypothetical protein
MLTYFFIIKIMVAVGSQENEVFTCVTCKINWVLGWIRANYFYVYLFPGVVKLE